MAIPSLCFAIGLAALLWTDRLRLDTDSRTYTHIRGIFPWRKKLRGDFTDFSRLRIDEKESVDSESNTRTRYLTLTLVWNDAAAREFELTKRPRGFADLGCNPRLQIEELASELATKLQIPVENKSQQMHS